MLAPHSRSFDLTLALYGAMDVSVQEALGIKLQANDDISALKLSGNLGKDAIWRRL
jgi:hypothetical protein